MSEITIEGGFVENGDKIYDIRIKPHPFLKEVTFPKSNLIVLDISKFNYKSASCCFNAVQEAIRERGKVEDGTNAREN